VEQPPADAGLFQELAPNGRIVRRAAKPLVHHLDGDLAPQNLVVRAMDSAHPPLREFPEEIVSFLEMGLAGDVTEELFHTRGVIVAHRTSPSRRDA
jgi:hypothetical protein